MQEPPTAAETRRPPLLVIFSITVTGILTNTLVNAPVPEILRDFSKSPASAGLLVASGTVAGVIMAPVIGFAADRLGRRKVLLPCLVAFGTFGTLAGFAPTFELLLLARLLQGFGAAGLLNLAVVLIGDHWSGVERTRVIGWNAAVLTVSLVVVPTLGGVLAELWGWRAAFAPYVTGFVTAAMVARWLEDRRPRSSAVTVREQIAEAFRLLRRPALASAVLFGFVLFVMIFGLFLTVMPILLEEHFGLGPAARGLAISVPAAGSTVGALFVGRLRSIWGRRRLLILGTGAWCVAFAVIGVAPVLSLVVLAELLYGLGEGLVVPTTQDFVTGSAPDDSRGAVVATFVSAVRAGQTVGPVSAAAAAQWVGEQGVFLIAAGVSLVLLAGAKLFVPALADDLSDEGRALRG